MKIRLSILLVLLLFSPAAHAQDAAPDRARETVERLFRAGPEASWFTGEFLAAVPADKVAALLNDLKRRHGNLRGSAREGDRYIVRLDRAEVPVRIALDDKGRIAGLRLEAAIPAGGTVEDHVKAIAALPGETSVLVVSNGKRRAGHGADRALAVGSAAKLAILKAVADAVAQGRLAWDQAVPLDARRRSLPTGILQDWPDGTPVTVATLANLMISISDNTATDALIHLVGRERVEAITPRNVPFPTTREFFLLKATEADELRKSWRAGDSQQRRKLLAEIAGAPLPPPTGLASGTADIEWFVSATELCGLLDAVADQPSLRINPGLADKERWRAVGFKGGSEPGVINYSTRLAALDGATHCVVATWNQPGLDAAPLQEHYRAILRALRDGN